MWKTYFKFVKLEPGRVVTALFGELDFSADDIGIEIIQALYESGFPYLEITERGKAEMSGVESTMNRDFAIEKPTRLKKSG